MNGYVKPREAAAHFGVSLGTLREWEKRGIIACIRTKAVNGQRRYDIRSFKNTDNISVSPEGPTEIPQPDCPGRERVCYCRVSSTKQRDDLQRQETYIQSLYPTHQIIKDIGSGLNWKRKGLISLLERTAKGTIEEVVVSSRDRLCRFGFELLQWFFSFYGTKLTVLEQDTSSPDEELAKDLMAIVHVFSCRANGKRRYTKKKAGQVPEEKDEDSE